MMMMMDYQTIQTTKGTYDKIFDLALMIIIDISVIIETLETVMIIT